MAKPNYIELPATAASQGFYEKAFGWTFESYGPTYAAAGVGEVGIGLQADPSEATKAPLPVIDVPDLEAAQAAVEAAGGRIVKPIFAFPGGRRFHFLDPGGNEIGVVRIEGHEH